MNGLRSVTPMAFVMARDGARARTFYREVLGLESSAEDEFGMEFDLAGVTMRLTAVPDFEPGAHPVLGWKVDDIVAAARALAARGVSFTIYPGFGQDELGIWSSPDGRTKVAWFNDSEGNVLSLAQSSR